MHPLIQQAQRIHAFDLTPEIGAVLLGDITTGGIIQYHYVLVVINKSSGSFLYVASEWSSQYSERKNTPALLLWLSISKPTGHSAPTEAPRIKSGHHVQPIL